MAESEKSVEDALLEVAEQVREASDELVAEMAALERAQAANPAWAEEARAQRRAEEQALDELMMTTAEHQRLVAEAEVGGPYEP